MKTEFILMLYAFRVYRSKKNGKTSEGALSIRSSGKFVGTIFTPSWRGLLLGIRLVCCTMYKEDYQ